MLGQSSLPRPSANWGQRGARPARQTDLQNDAAGAMVEPELPVLSGDQIDHEDVTVTTHRIYTTSVASVYPHYVAKAERKGRTQAEVDQIITWLTGHTAQSLAKELDAETDFETFFASAPRLNPDRSLIKGVVCGVRVEEVEEDTMREIRYLDKLIDELAKGKSIEKILRS